MTIGFTKTDIGPLTKRDDVPIPMAIMCAALASAPVWLALGWVVTLVR
ncbi:hypothetical protein [Sphingomonas montana]|nr:hypothetical protein [Sphingomonas montana]